MGDEPKSLSWSAPGHGHAHGPGGNGGNGGGGGGGGGGDVSELAALLAPALISACDGRLSQPEWFRSTWQAGGAATAFATYRFDNGETVPVVVKLPVGPAEYRWTVGLGLAGGAGAGTPGWLCPTGPTPCVLAAGTELGGYDLAWLVVERLGGSPLNKSLCKETIEGLLLAAADWYERSARLQTVPAGTKGKSEDWEKLLAKARAAVREGQVPAEEQRWGEALKLAHKHIGRLAAAWESRPIETWCHGDLHPGNAMRRWEAAEKDGAAAPHGPGSGVVLIDLALVHAGHWVEDAVYLERLFWGRSDLLGGVKPVSFLARAIRDRGLQTPEDYTQLANVRRTLMAATAPAFLSGEGHPKYIHAALEMLERALPLAIR